ncbi:M23 family metallopeptidase [Sphingobacterium sp. SRCM116780]|uniref:M23 family metallopeptidase n=1 Tax=Sphingobacterium sp. SRCM116780 TaxID=2907623 RepID=UPI001F23BA81|nr:M23 family metallopeptidase [Sphingobacterium sp. SRCM116780]UIR56196.1 M23 family metallopeptidase [Sphingobacterium sp. SRCM116780]
MKKLSCIIGLLASTLTITQAQDIIKHRQYPQNYFRRPMDIAPQASGSFGELRATHFHGGDDYRTQQKINIPVYAAADGFVSRIRVQIGGGGNSVYLDHPNGYTSVYLHLESFNEELNAFIKSEQYKQKKFEIDVFLKPGQFTLKKGQLLANSGNTGGSAGPHLHFEIRDTKLQLPFNTQLFGLTFPDETKPIIRGLTVYDLDDPIFNENTPRRHQTVKALTNGNYSLSSTSPIPVNGKFGFGINTVDKRKGISFSYGVYSIELFLDNKTISTVLFESIPFDKTRAIHSYIDYPYWEKSNVRVQKSFRQSGNPIDIYYNMDNNGIMELKDDQVHQVRYVVKDVQGNATEINFNVQRDANYTVRRTPSTAGKYFNFLLDNVYQTGNVKISIPKNTLYDNLNFEYSEGASPVNGYSQLQKVHNKYTPVFGSYTLSIRPNSNLTKDLYSKALLVSTEDGAQGGKYENGLVTASVRSFGDFYIAIDDVAPTITARNLVSNKNVAAQKQIDFTISDNLSGIQSFNAYIDGDWVLMKYDPKNRHIWHTFEPNLREGKHNLRLEVKDWKDNVNVYEASFTR